MRTTCDKPGILVVDDDTFVRNLVVTTLKRNGFEVWSAANGNDAIALYREHADGIDVVLLDVCMTGLDGPQTLEALRQENSDVIACFMSGSLGHYRREDLITSRGAVCVFDKPFHLDNLVNVVRLLAHGTTAA